MSLSEIIKKESIMINESNSDNLSELFKQYLITEFSPASFEKWIINDSLYIFEFKKRLFDALGNLGYVGDINERAPFLRSKKKVTFDETESILINLFRGNILNEHIKFSNPEPVFNGRNIPSKSEKSTMKFTLTNGIQIGISQQNTTDTEDDKMGGNHSIIGISWSIIRGTIQAWATNEMKSIIK